MIRVRSTSTLLVVLTAAMLLNGCAGRAETPRPAPSAPVASPSPSTTATVESTVTETETDESASGSSRNLSAQELARIRAQLDAMQDEIDNLQMPSDDDFDGAASDLY